MDPQTTGKIIFEKRKEKGLNQIQLGQLLNVSNRTISKWENGDGFPDITLLPDIADCLGITIDELLTGEKPTPILAETIKNDTKKLLSDFKLCFIVALFLALCGALLGGITELYCIWAFPILFYTHWEIMFAAVSLFAVIASTFVFVVGIFRLHTDYTKDEIICLAKGKALLLFIILAVFPLSFVARVIDFSSIGRFTAIIMSIIVIILAVMIVLLSRRIKSDKGD